MNIRLLKLEDEQELREIHAKYYSEEFTFDDFTRGFLISFAVEDESGRIISAGGLRPLVEAVIMTDKSHSVRDRREALYNMLAAFVLAGMERKIDSIHAFIQDEDWLNHLKQIGFKETKGKSLVLNI